jgi:hypothetical protein
MTDSLSDRLRDHNYVPSQIPTSLTKSTTQKKICPVRFTEDVIEYCQGEEFLQATLRKLQKDFLLDLYELDEKGYPKYDTGVFIAGMRGGKSMLAAIIASFQLHKLLAMQDPAAQLHQFKGQRLTLQFIASSEAQAQETAYASFEAIINNAPWWVKYIEWLKEREETEGLGKGSLFEMLSNRIEFKEKNIAALSLHSNSAALVGKTSACCIFDELSRFDVAEGAIQTKTQKRSAQAVYDGVAKAATSLMPFSKVVTITSPMYEDDYGMRLLYMSGTFRGGSQSGIIHTLRKQYPMKVERQVGYHATTFELNPKVDENGNDIPGGFSEEDAFFKGKKIESPEGFRRDYLAIPPSAVSPFFEYPERIDACIVKNRSIVDFHDREFDESVQTVDGDTIVRKYIGKSIIVNKPNMLMDYFISCDQGEKKDAFVVAMGHGDEVSYDSVDGEGKPITFTRYKVIIDFIEGWIPDKEKRITVSFPNVEDIIVRLSENFNIRKVVFDQWNSTESLQRLFSKGIVAEKTKQQENLKKYEILKTLVYSNLIELPESDILVKELRQLNLIRGVKVDHPGAGSSDHSDAIARVVWEVYTNVIEKAIQGEIPGPRRHQMPTIRSVASMYEHMSGPMISPICDFATTSPATKSSIFGRGFMVEGNIKPNFLTK